MNVDEWELVDIFGGQPIRSSLADDEVTSSLQDSFEIQFRSIPNSPTRTNSRTHGPTQSQGNSSTGAPINENPFDFTSPQHRSIAGTPRAGSPSLSSNHHVGGALSSGQRESNVLYSDMITGAARASAEASVGSDRDSEGKASFGITTSATDLTRVGTNDGVTSGVAPGDILSSSTTATSTKRTRVTSDKEKQRQVSNSSLSLSPVTAVNNKQKATGSRTALASGRIKTKTATSTASKSKENRGDGLGPMGLAALAPTTKRTRTFSSSSNDPNMTEEERRFAKLEKNRQSARDCRKRKKEYVNGLESERKAIYADFDLMKLRVEELERANEEMIEALKQYAPDWVPQHAAPPSTAMAIESRGLDAKSGAKSTRGKRKQSKKANLHANKSSDTAVATSGAVIGPTASSKRGSNSGVERSSHKLKATAAASNTTKTLSVVTSSTSSTSVYPNIASPIAIRSI